MKCRYAPREKRNDPWNGCKYYGGKCPKGYSPNKNCCNGKKNNPPSRAGKRRIMASRKYFVFSIPDEQEIPKNRTRYIALYGALGALGVTAGSLIGGNLGPHLPKISGSYFLTLFLIAGITKLLVVLGLFRNISEVRSVPPVKVIELLFGDLRSNAVVRWWRRNRDRTSR